MKKFGKGAPAPAVVEEAEDAVEAADAALEADAAEGDEAPTKGAPRARKWNYGITPEGVITRVKGAEGGPKGCKEAWEATEKPIKVEDFANEVDDWRHALRVMMRGKYVTLKANGQTYPQEYDHAAAAEAREARAKAKAEKAAAEAEDDGEADEAPAKAPAKPAPRKK